MPTLVDRLWEGGGYGSRRDRRAYRYQAYVPDPIAEAEPQLGVGALVAVDGATRALATLNARTFSHDLEALAGPLLRAEAVGSSFIEGLRVSHKKLALAAYEPVVVSVTARAVLGNVRAMDRAIEIGSSDDELTVEAIAGLHQVLLEGTSEARFAGRIRQEQNWIGGRPSGPLGAAFVPPPWELVPNLLDDLVAFCNRDDVPPVVQAAIAHAQFELIHPFGDGNGRAGRCLIHIVLRRRGVIPAYAPPISVVLARDPANYIAGLTAFREADVGIWCGQFADAVSAASHSAEELGARLGDLVTDLTAQAGRLRADSVARRILTGLTRHPIVSAETAAELYGVSPRAARAALTQLQERGVLDPLRVGRRRGREWTSDALFELLDSYEYDIGG